MTHDEVIIRAYAAQDRASVRAICCDTAFVENAVARIFPDREVLADALLQYFTDCEPESCFVAECGRQVVGYIVGAVDVSRMRRIQATRLFPALFFKACLRGWFFRPCSLRFLAHVCASACKGEFAAPDFSTEYPATLHINIAEAFRGECTGSKLMQRYLAYLNTKGVSGVHMGSMSEDALRFFQREGFSLLFQGKRTYMRYAVGKDVPFYVLGKRL